MIRISDISMPLHYTDEALRRAAAKKLRTDAQKLKKLALVKRSVDARKKQDVHFVVTVDVETDGNEDKLLSRVRDSHVTKAPKRTYAIPPHGTLSQRPVVVGFGPAGMFAGLLLARAGLRPIILERGGSVEERQHLLADAKTKPKLQRAVRRGRRRHVFGRQTQYRHER